MQTASSWIWTWRAVSISYNDIHYTTSAGMYTRKEGRKEKVYIKNQIDMINCKNTKETCKDSHDNILIVKDANWIFHPVLLFFSYHVYVCV